MNPQRYAVSAVGAVVALVMTVVLVFSTATGASSESSTSNTRVCIKTPAGIKICGKLLGNLPTVTLTLPGRTKTVKVRLPGAIRTTRVRVPGPVRSRTHYVHVPGPTKTVHPAGQTQVVTVHPETVTKTVTVSPSGQTRHTHGTLGPSVPADQQPYFNLHTREGVTRTVGIGLLSLLALVAMGVILASYGFRVGRRVQSDEDTNFMREVLDSVKTRGKHS